MNRPLFALALCWLGSWIIIFADDASTLPHAPRDEVGFLMGEMVVLAFVGVLIWMTRHRTPVGHAGGIVFNRPGMETGGVTIYLIGLVLIGWVLDLPAHVGSLGLTDQTLHAWESETARTLLMWAAYYGVFGAFIPWFIFQRVRGYRSAELLLAFPARRKWIPYVLVTGIMGVGAFAGPEFVDTPFLGHIATLLLFTFGTFLPVMILTQCLLAPRFAYLTRSWITGAVLTGLVYGVYHAGEFYLEWSSPGQVALSLAWLMQFVFFGFLKGVSTLRTGSAWIHIFNTHTPHLAEAPEVARIFGIR